MPKSKTKNSNEAHILLRINPLDKEYILRESEKEGVTMTEFILRRVIPQKYQSVIEWEQKFSKDLQSV